jgi:drug/metabolite transporter (DMT)-like permease
MSVLLAALAALSWGTSDFVGGLASREHPARSVVVWSQICGVVLALIAAPVLGGDASGGDLVWGALAGVGGGIGLVALYTGLAGGKISVVAPVSGVISAGVPVVFGLAIGERPGTLGMVGMVVAVLAIWLVSAGEQVGTSGLGQALIAGLGFAFFFMAIGQTGDGAGLWPLLPARVASIAVVGGLSLLGAESLAMPPVGRVKVAVAGIGDIIANMFFLLASQTGLLSIAAVVSSLFPAPTVLLGRLVLGEQVRTQQWIGLGLALVAVGLIAL